MQTQFGEFVTVTQDGNVAIITIDKPPHNFVSVGLVRDLADAYEAIDAEMDLRCIVLQTAGKNFCAGADLVNREEMGGLGANFNPLYEQALRLYAANTPVVAAVQGSAVGAGLGLAISADFRIAAQDAKFCANFVSLSFHPGFGITHVLPCLIGRSHADLMLLTGRRIKADQALDWGLAEEVVPVDELRPAAKRLAQEIAQNGPLGVMSTRATLRLGMVEAVRRQTGIEAAEQYKLRDTEDHKEGVRAVSERRAGNFIGR